jgi:hypothetical protein
MSKEEVVYTSKIGPIRARAIGPSLSIETYICDKDACTEVCKYMAITSAGPVSFCDKHFKKFLTKNGAKTDRTDRTDRAVDARTPVPRPYANNPFVNNERR